jgi:hypothetical protein
MRGISSGGGEIVIGTYSSRPHGPLPVDVCVERFGGVVLAELGLASGPLVPALLRGNMHSPSSTQEPISRIDKPQSHLLTLRYEAAVSRAGKPELNFGGEEYRLFMLFSKVAVPEWENRALVR